MTWVYGPAPEPGAASEVEIRLSPEGEDRTAFDFAHTAIVPDEMWDEYGPGAVGVGWDGGLLGLGLHLRGGSIEDSEALAGLRGGPRLLPAEQRRLGRSEPRRRRRRSDGRAQRRRHDRLLRAARERRARAALRGSRPAWEPPSVRG